MITARLGSVVIDPLPIAALSRSPGGAGIVADLMRRGTNVQTSARGYVGVRTGQLQRGIVKRLEWRDVPVVVVGADVSHAYVHHEGSPPHLIMPRNRSVLRFPVGGRMVFARVVRHPGTTGTRYLVRALPAAAH